MYENLTVELMSYFHDIPVFNSHFSRSIFFFNLFSFKCKKPCIS